MKTQIRMSILIGLLIFGLQTTLKAQDKYEFAKVYAVAGYTKLDGIYVMISGKEMEWIEVKWKILYKYYTDYTPLLNYIQKMSDEGWEVITVDTGTYYLKRKKK